MESEINKIKNMSFDQLREELSLCKNNPVKELIIRKMMKNRYLELKNRKQRLINQRKMKELSRIEEANYQRQFNNNLENENIVDDNLVDELFEDIQRLKNRDNDMVDIFNESDFKPLPNHGPLNALDPNASLYDRKFKQEIEKDHMNNHLMDRLNSDIDIKKMSKRNKKKNFDMPFSNNIDANYASINSDEGIILSNDFSSRRLYRTARR